MLHTSQQPLFDALLNHVQIVAPIISEDVVIILGPPGVGKGTQAQQLPGKHVSTGAILREAVANQTELGVQIKSLMDSGRLVPDELVMDLVSRRILQPDCIDGCSLDGVPRTVPQAEELIAMLGAIGKRPRVIELVARDEVLIDRIVKRGQSGSGRSDDTEEVARDRLKEYWEKTKPVSDYFASLGLLIQIDGEGTPEEVNKKVMSALGIEK